MAIKKETDPIKQLAVMLHQKQCRSNHIDQCGWEYEYVKDENSNGYVADWSRYSHKSWLEEAKELAYRWEKEGISIEIGMKVMSTL